MARTLHEKSRGPSPRPSAAGGGPEADDLFHVGNRGERRPAPGAEAKMELGEDEHRRGSHQGLVGLLPSLNQAIATVMTWVAYI